MTDTEPPLYASMEKVKRAQSKLDNIATLLGRFRQVKPYSMNVERDLQFLYVVARLEKSPPAAIGWELVEAVGHLRGALDKLMVELAEKNRRGTSGVGFPFGSLGEDGKPNPFPDRRVEAGIKKKLTPDQWALVETYKPYPGGNDILWAINQIANADKHWKGLVETRPAFGHAGAFRHGDPGLPMRLHDVIINPTNCDHVLKNKKREKVLYRLSNQNFNVKIDSRIAVDIVFGDLVPVQGKGVLQTLNEQIGLTDRILQTFRTQFF